MKFVTLKLATVSTTRSARTVDRLFASVLAGDKLVLTQKPLEVEQPLSQEEIEPIETLVKDSIGFDEERGDSVLLKVLSLLIH